MLRSKVQTTRLESRTQLEGMMSDAITGGCLCGAIQYEIPMEPVFAAHCFCRDCQRESGAGHASVAAFPNEAVNIRGKVASYCKRTDNGAMATRRFCGTCGSTLFSNSTNNMTLTMVHAGTFDDPGRFAPKVGVYEKQRAAWDHLDPHLTCYPGMPSRG